MSEIFNEIDDELRREQLKKLWDKYSVYIVALAVLIVLGVGGWRGYEYYMTQKAYKASAAYDAAAALSDENKHAEAEAAFTALAADAPAGYRALARLRAAADASSRDPKAGVKLYDEISADAGVGANERALASVRAATLLLDTDSYDDMQKRLQAVAQPGGIYRHTARELLALSAWRNNNIAEARKWLDQIAEDGESPATLRSRAEALQAVLPPAAKS
ncbi:MAG TPA: tetratricopeptide repeat protein [Xanthobacteraceae bacterium]|nr:tetratricopeptide repeat protein [Xanthobacteraceae bacterium]